MPAKYRINVEFVATEEELEEFEDTHGRFEDWLWGEICSNHGFGMITGYTTDRFYEHESEDDEEE